MVAAIKNQWAQLSDRAKYGLVVLAALLGFDLLTRVDDFASGKANDRAIVQDQFASTRDVIDFDEWQKRADEAVVSLEDWRRQLWSGPTPGIVAADIQSYMNGVGTSFNLGGQKTEVDPEPIAIAQGQGLRFRVQASMSSSAQFARFFGALEEASPVMFIDELSLNISRDGRGFFEMSGVAPIDLLPPEGAPSVPVSEQRS